MAQIFIDGGGNWKRSVDRYLRLCHYDRVYVFEPNPIFHASYSGSNYVFIKKAMWVDECVMSFFPSKDANQVAGSLFSFKKSKVMTKDGIELQSNYWGEVQQVECIDFSKWLKSTIAPTDIVTLKLDIEGAEYTVLTKLIQDGTISMINRLYVEFHSDTMLDNYPNWESNLRLLLTNRGLPPLDWD